MAAWALWALVMLGLAASMWLEVLLRRAGRGDPLDTAVGPIVAMVSAATVGAVLAGHRPCHPVGWLLLAFALSLTINGVAGAYAPYGLQVRPGGAPGRRLGGHVLPGHRPGGADPAGLCAAADPDRVAASPRWRWWAWLTAGVLAVLLVAMPLAPRPPEERYQGVDNPLDLRPFEDAAGDLPGRARCGRPGPPGRSRVPWWRGTAGPAGWSASSCAGWSWPPP